MKCPSCKVEMLIDTTRTSQWEEVFTYKCPNPACNQYGYGGGKGSETAHGNPESE